MRRALAGSAVMLSALGAAFGCKGRAARTHDGASQNTMRIGDPCNPPYTILVKHLVPPEKNPYPPSDALAQRRVRLANEAIAAFYTKQPDELALREHLKVLHDAGLDDTTKGPDAFEFQGKSSECLRDVTCWSKDYAFLKRLAGLASSLPPCASTGVSAARTSRVMDDALAS